MKKRKSSNNSLYEDNSIREALEALEEHIKKSTRSEQAAHDSLLAAGIIGKNGKLRKRYRS